MSLLQSWHFRHQTGFSARLVTFILPANDCNRKGLAGFPAPDTGPPGPAITRPDGPERASGGRTGAWDTSRRPDAPYRRHLRGPECHLPWPLTPRGIFRGRLRGSRPRKVASARRSGNSPGRGSTAPSPARYHRVAGERGGLAMPDGIEQQLQGRTLYVVSDLRMGETRWTDTTLTTPVKCWLPATPTRPAGIDHGT